MAGEQPQNDGETGDAANSPAPASTPTAAAHAESSIPLARRVWINVLIVVFFGIAAVHVSPPGPFHSYLEQALNPLTGMLQISQHWNMFAPVIRDINQHGQTFVTMQDGTVRMYEWQRSDWQDAFTRWQRGKDRELWYDRLPDTATMTPFYPGICRYMANALSIPGEEPDVVSLGANWVKIPPMSQPVDREKRLRETGHYSMFVYKCGPEDWR